jgi:hypothetical protein
MEILTQSIQSILQAEGVDHTLVGNGDILLTTPTGKSFYFTISTSRWRRKGKKVLYSSKGIEDFLERYFN